MNLVIKSAVAAVLLSAVSVSAFAVSVTPPPSGPAPSPTVGNGGLMLEIFDTTTNHYDTLWLGGDLGTFTSSATPAGGVTFDYGTVSNFSTLFSSSDVTAKQVSFVVAASNTSIAGGNQLITTLSKIPTSNTFTNSAIQNAATGIQNGVTLFDAASGCNGVNPCGATSTTDANYLGNQLNGRYNNGLPTTASAAGVVGGTAVGFYTLTQTQSGPGNGTLAQFANATGNGTWSVSATGDVTYTIAGASAVPLPAAIWLLGSGLVGLAGIGRRRLKAA